LTKSFGRIMSLSSDFCHFFPNTESLIFRNLIFHKNKRINELYFQFEARHKNIGKKMAEIMIILNMSQYYTKTFAIENCSIFFKSGICEKNILCVRKKKYCNQNKYQINQNLVLRVWFALLNSRHKLILEFWKFFEQLFSSLSKISLVFVYLSKKLPKHFLSKCQIK